MTRQNGSQSKVPSLAARVKQPRSENDAEPKKPLSLALRKLADKIYLGIRSSQSQFVARQMEICDEYCVLLVYRERYELEVGNDRRVAERLFQRDRAGNSGRVKKLRALISKTGEECVRMGERNEQLGQKYRRLEDAREDMPRASLHLDQFKEAKSAHDLAVEICRVEMEISLTTKRMAKLTSLMDRMEAEIHSCIVANLCATIHPDKARVGFHMHLAKNLEVLSEINTALAISWEKKAEVERAHLENYTEIQRRLANAVRLQADLERGGRGKGK